MTCFLLEPAVVAQTPAAPAGQPQDAAPPSFHATDDKTILHCGDAVKITVYGEDDLTTETIISKDGTVRFPLLGSVALAGKTVEQATLQIRNALGARYIRDPRVTLTIATYAKQTLTILGEVKRPGKIEMPDDGELDLLGAVALAGGFTDIAETGHIIVRRVIDGKDQILEVDARKLAHDSSVKPFYVVKGDTITVRQRMF
jgi:polysaccharide export outer membrane protein